MALSPKDQEAVNNHHSNVVGNRSMFVDALRIYEYDINSSRGIAAGELNNIGLPRVDREITAISAAREYIQRLKLYHSYSSISVSAVRTGFNPFENSFH